MTVHWLKEIETPAFEKFLAKAAEAFQGAINRKQLKPAELTPWKVLGRKWHVSRKGFPSGKRVRWEPELLERLFDLLQSVAPQADVDWGNKQVVYFRRKNSDAVWAAVHTKRRQGVDLSLYNETGRVALGRITELGREREISTSGNGRDQISIRFDRAEQIVSQSLAAFVREHVNM